MQQVYQTEMVCSKEIHFDIDENNIVTNISFVGGCNGNLKAISKLLDGKSAEEINALLAGNTCGRRPTSCADQLAKAVMAASIKK